MSGPPQSRLFGRTPLQDHYAGANGKGTHLYYLPQRMLYLTPYLCLCNLNRVVSPWSKIGIHRLDDLYTNKAFALFSTATKDIQIGGQQLNLMPPAQDPALVSPVSRPEPH